ncbi:MAG TPA: ABC transporter permease [Actinomycetes bacterium]
MSELLEDAAEPRAEAAPGLLRRRLTETTTWTFLILLGIVVGFTLLRFEQFATVFNIRNIAVDASGLMILAVAMTFVIITAGIDLSVGSMLVFSGVIAAKVMLAVGGGGWGAIAAGAVAGLVAGLAWGIVNGVLVTKARVPPLIVTLGTLGMALGAALLITGGIDVRGIPLRLTTTIGIGQLFGVPYVVLIAAVVTAVGAVVLGATRFGRYTYAIGSNAEAARRAGIDVDRHLIKVYALSGLLAGLAGMVSLARFATTTIGGHSTDNLAAIAAVVLGGTSLFGGMGTVLGTVVGVFIPAVLQNGFVILGVQPFWQQVAVGAVLIVAVYIDQLKRRAQERGERR